MAQPRKYRRRKTDPWLARVGMFWDFMDQREVDRRIISWVVLGGTVSIVMWAAEFAWYSTRPGLEVAAIIAAVTAPYSALQTFVAKYTFERQQK